jgi:hypothetical protein
MSSVSIQGNASGTGIFTIASPNSNTNRTLTLPDNTGTIITTASTVSYPKGGPAFRAYNDSDDTGKTGATFVKIRLNTENFDTNNCFDSTTNYRFTPNVAGYYQFNMGCWINASNIALTQIDIYKNGSSVSGGQFFNVASGVTSNIVNMSDVVYLDGSTDYVEFYAYATTTAGTWTIKGTSRYTWASGFLARAD